MAATLVLSGHAADDGKAADPKKLKAEGDRAFRNEKYQEVWCGLAVLERCRMCLCF